MTLSEKDGQLFYKLWLTFLDYVNEKCKVNKKVKDMANAKSLDSMEATFILILLFVLFSNSSNKADFVISLNIISNFIFLS